MQEMHQWFVTVIDFVDLKTFEVICMFLNCWCSVIVPIKTINFDVYCNITEQQRFLLFGYYGVTVCDCYFL